MNITGYTLQFAGRKRPSNRNDEDERPLFVPRRPKKKAENPENLLEGYDPRKDPFRDQFFAIERELSSSWEFYKNRRVGENRELVLKESIQFLYQRFKKDPDFKDCLDALKAFTEQKTWEKAKPYYRKLARRCHPDVVSSPPDATALISHINNLKPKNK